MFNSCTNVLLIDPYLLLHKPLEPGKESLFDLRQTMRGGGSTHIHHTVCRIYVLLGHTRMG